jgi:hypothetical protein
MDASISSFDKIRRLLMRLSAYQGHGQRNQEDDPFYCREKIGGRVDSAEDKKTNRTKNYKAGMEDQTDEQRKRSRFRIE